MKLIDGTRVDSPRLARNPLRETVLRLDHMRRRAVGLCVECMKEEPIYAKNRCRACYEWLRRDRPLGLRSEALSASTI
jgi:hypothetical protein